MSIFEAVKKYLEMGVDGFHIDHISMMAVDANGNPDVREKDHVDSPRLIIFVIFSRVFRDPIR